MKIKRFTFIIFLICTIPLFGKENVYCTKLDSSRREVTRIQCYNTVTREYQDVTIPNFKVKDFERKLSQFFEVKFVNQVEYSVFVVNEISDAPGSRACFQKAAYQTKENHGLVFFADESQVIARMKRLAETLINAGVCDMKVKPQNFNDIDIKTPDDVLQHFLCLANGESNFGKDNLGLGGRGPWGVHPGYNQKKGTKAYFNDQWVTLKKDGLCYPGQSTYRDKSGKEIKDNDVYYDNHLVLRDNAKCAMTLYRELDGFAPWGKGKDWGTNRHCSKEKREEIYFIRYLDELACCTDECIQQVILEKSFRT